VRAEGGKDEAQAVPSAVGGEVERAHVDVERNEALEGQRANAEVFKSVFEEDW